MLGWTKHFSVTFITLLLLTTSVMAVETIQRKQPTDQAAGNFGILDGLMQFIAAYWIVLLALAGGVFILMFLMKWWKTVRERDNVFLRDYNRTVQLCKLQSNPKRIKERAIWMYLLVVSVFVSVMLFVIAVVLDDISAFMFAIGIFIVGMSASAILKLGKFFAYHDIVQIIGQFGAKIIGYYQGECITSDGYKNFLLFSGRKYVFWKNIFVVKVNMNENLRIETRDDKSGERKIKEYNLPKDLLIEGENVIAIKGEGLDKAGYFFYPLIADEKGNIVNMDLIAYTRSRDVALLDTLYQQTEDFANVQRQAINMNPNIRYRLKSGGESVGTGQE